MDTFRKVNRETRKIQGVSSKPVFSKLPLLAVYVQSYVKVINTLVSRPLKFKIKS